MVCPKVINLVCANIFATVNSATAEAFLPGAFATIIDFFWQASKSMLTGPPLETPIYFRFITLSKIDSLTGARSVTNISLSSIKFITSSSFPRYSLILLKFPSP